MPSLTKWPPTNRCAGNTENKAQNTQLRGFAKCNRLTISRLGVSRCKSNCTGKHLTIYGITGYILHTSFAANPRYLHSIRSACTGGKHSDDNEHFPCRQSIESTFSALWLYWRLAFRRGRFGAFLPPKARFTPSRGRIGPYLPPKAKVLPPGRHGRAQKNRRLQSAGNI